MSKNESSRSGTWINYIGLALLIVSYLGAVYNTLSTKLERSGTDKKVIIISHWQLEKGFREAFDWVIAEYEKLHPDVKVIQLPIYAQAYRQFMNTQLIGGTAPDIIEVGQGIDKRKGNTNARFFYPLSPYLSDANPYNEGTDLEGTPWIETFKHGLEWNWDEKNLDYYTIGITGVSSRLAYNKDLLKEITGSVAPPDNFTDFIELCRELKAYSDSTGKNIWPIASSRYQVNALLGKLKSSMIYSFVVEHVDRNHDALEDVGTEVLLSWLEQQYDFDDDELRVGHEISRDVLPYLEPGFMAKNRQDATFSFAQQKAVMISAASWDMNTLRLQAQEGGFELGVIEVPLPDEDHPVYGKYVDGRAAEAKEFNMPFGVCRFSKHPKVAIDFLKFYSAQKVAEEFCRRAGWLCAIKGAENVDFIDPFEPDYRGYPRPSSPYYAGTETKFLYQQASWKYTAGDASFEEMIQRFRKGFYGTAMKDFNGHLHNFEGNLAPVAHNGSNLALRLKFTEDKETRDRLQYRLENANESYADFWTSLQGNIYEMVNIARNMDNERLKKVQETMHYRVFLEEFPHVAVTR